MIMVLSKGQCNTYKNGIEIMDSCACMCAYSKQSLAFS